MLILYALFLNKKLDVNWKNSFNKKSEMLSDLKAKNVCFVRYNHISIKRWTNLSKDL